MQKVRVWKTTNFVLAILLLSSVVFAKDPKIFLTTGGILTALASSLNFFYLRNFWLGVSPILFLLGFYGSLATVSLIGLKFLLGFLAASFYYGFELKLWEKPAEEEELFTLVTAFLLWVGVFAAALFLSLPWWLASLLIFILGFLLFGQAFFKFGVLPRQRTLRALIGALILVEASWVILFLPFFFLTAATMLFGFFYIIYVLSRLEISGSMSRKQVYFQIGFIFLVEALALLGSTWSP